MKKFVIVDDEFEMSVAHTQISQKLIKVASMTLSTVIPKKKNVSVFLKYLTAACEDADDPENEFRRAVYQVVGDILRLNGGKASVVLKQVKQGSVGWQHVMFIPYEEKIQEHDDYIVHPFDVVEGIAECQKCGSKRTFSNQMQTRGADEPMTTFTCCAKCGHKWTYSG